MSTPATKSALSREKTITITLADDGTPQVSKAQDPITLKKFEHECIIWECISPFTVLFDQESPFHEAMYDQNFPFSGLIRRDVRENKGKTYKYTVIVAGKSLDPGVIIDK